MAQKMICRPGLGLSSSTGYIDIFLEGVLDGPGRNGSRMLRASWLL
jgi:hypothetical protein